MKQDKQKLVLFAVAALIVLVLDYQLLAVLSAKGRALNKKLTEQKNKIASLERDLTKMCELKEKQARTKERILPKIRKILPEAEKIALLQQISDIANKNNIRIQQIKPVTDVKQEKAFLGAKIIPFYISLELAADYHSLGRFINDLENAEALMAVQDIMITKDQKDFLKEKVTLMVRAYVKK
ncbi:MAG: hypothetical protein FJZ09_03145 [Candidatus Omnitrophica bacterium]|nr:hypothetical protein [Candidatus Omnitrophota bacterium]